jgi:hypothetical protein
MVIIGVSPHLFSLSLSRVVSEFNNGGSVFFIGSVWRIIASGRRRRQMGWGFLMSEALVCWEKKILSVSSGVGLGFRGAEHGGRATLSSPMVTPGQAAVELFLSLFSSGWSSFVSKSLGTTKSSLIWE